jgi:tRNA threonylcarbamoyladenosine biosynthesis protein TsaE
MARTILCDQAGIEVLGAIVAGKLRPGDAILLEGPLGAGKSTFARALIRAACKAPALDVPSPSYTLVQSYEAEHLRLHHFDLWRLGGPDALVELGWDDALADVVIVEWPDRLGPVRPANPLVISIAPVAEDRRRITLDGWEDRLPVVESCGLSAGATGQVPS